MIMRYVGGIVVICWSSGSSKIDINWKLKPEPEKLPPISGQNVFFGKKVG